MLGQVVRNLIPGNTFFSEYVTQDCNFRIAIEGADGNRQRIVTGLPMHEQV